MIKRRSSQGTSQSIDVAFELELEYQRELLFGIALFFDAISAWYRGQKNVIESYRKQFTGLIRDGSTQLEEAEALLERVRAGEADASDLENYSFDIAAKHPEPDALLERAGALVDAYAKLFPGRDRTQELAPEETLQLVETAAVNMDAATG